MGRIVTKISIYNRGDQVLAERNLIAPSEVRSLELNEVLVDTGATTLCLPAPQIEQLGLSLLREVPVTTAQGMATARIFQDAKLSLFGREGTFECLELPADADPLLGVIPLEFLGIELDLKNQELRLLPLDPQASYLRI
ncbi:aspartyl protease family protein [Spirulina sp. CS-785/01]|uniref:retroviral-like aspartic protease family protein n=1 Tax=Spirulina sp. CS-785/01 TaxID=3021716 RepID=UPI00232B5528|nr:retroviral-like aspartic protease family protein [Spirulina sp. CS-785/01]MDB9311956.1 aspartyl protease family protein [Spirulina sp. CS-785/01]